MNVRFAYNGRSGLYDTGAQQTFGLAANVAREPVAFDAPLIDPLRFREAISSLHDVVISDLRYKKKDKTAYLQWKKGQAEAESAQRRAEFQNAKQEIMARRAKPVPPDLHKSYEDARHQYWQARQEYSNYLLRHDRDLWRKLMPCDPVITVADDVCFFECFSGDESSYGCLSVDREATFGKAERIQLGTTNVDYSWDLYHYFQGLRTYRPTRFRVDPEGFEAATTGERTYREEKIDLPAGWLRGFMQLQVAMTLPMTRVSLSREAVYSILAWLKRHKARTSPRAMRFELLPGKPPRIVLEPWGQPIESTGTIYDGPPVEPIRIWGTRRLLVLGRLLGLADAFDVYLPGTGLPSFWVARMGAMRLTLGLSGWVANDWTSGAALDMLLPTAQATPQQVESVAAMLRERRRASFAELQASLFSEGAAVAAALRHLAHSGQAIYDLSAGVYRWRQVMSQALGEAEMGPEHEEQAGFREVLARGRITIDTEQPVPPGSLIVTGNADGKPVEMMIDADGRIKRGKCLCGYFRKFALKNGPCRHMQALRYSSGIARNLGRSLGRI